MNLAPAEIFEQLHVKPRPGRTLIVGSRLAAGREDRRRRFQEAVGVDMQPGRGVDVVADLEEPCGDLGEFAHVECLSVLEHSRRPWLLAANLERLLVRRGTLFLSAPFVWRFHGYPSDYWRFTAEGVRSLFSAIKWSAVCYASDALRDDPYLPALEKRSSRTSISDKRAGEWPRLPRCEVLAFGVRR